MRHGFVQGVHPSQETVIFEEPLILLVPLFRFHLDLYQLERWSNTVIPAGVNIGVTSSYMTKKVDILDWRMQATSLHQWFFQRKICGLVILIRWRGPETLIHISPQHCSATSSHICNTTWPTRSMAMPKKNRLSMIFHPMDSTRRKLSYWQSTPVSPPEWSWRKECTISGPKCDHKPLEKRGVLPRNGIVPWLNVDESACERTTDRRDRGDRWDNGLSGCALFSPAASRFTCLSLRLVLLREVLRAGFGQLDLQRGQWGTPPFSRAKPKGRSPQHRHRTYDRDTPEHSNPGLRNALL
jgi:hypothetical protein